MSSSAESILASTPHSRATTSLAQAIASGQHCMRLASRPGSSHPKRIAISYPLDSELPISSAERLRKQRCCPRTSSAAALSFFTNESANTPPPFSRLSAWAPFELHLPLLAPSLASNRL